MYRELLNFNLPDLLSNLINVKQVTVYTYAFCIALGSLVATLYTKWSAKKDLAIELSNSFFYIIFIAGFIGGKLFYYLEKPIFYCSNPSLLYDNFSGGFVFYGSFVTCIPTVIWYLKKKKIAILPMLDILAITTLIAHCMGRIGCYCAGCCYGLPTRSFVGIVFPTSNSTSVHPTQLYEATILLLLLIALLVVKKYKSFNGQVFILYLSIYALSRAFLELFRGDERGYIFDGYLSHSQFIALLLLGSSFLFYKKLNQNKSILKN